MSRPQPERTCIGCRVGGSKGSLIRVVRSPSGEVQVDATGHAPGRGAYVHPSAECIRAGSRGGGLGRALRVRMDPDGAARLMEDLLERAGALD